MKVGEIMTQPVITILVVKYRKPVGIVARHDLLRMMKANEALYDLQ
ncbi:MAG TPA: hypothetical protein VJ124_01060 [Pyrinomonadaceae bacterium]|nr:hypothetical protein [Pyrinomonadaceae bacterium]